MFNFHPRIMAGVQSLGYLTPTPIQQQAIPPVLQGRDVMGLAQTGTGKTAVFALPILQRLMQRPHRHVRALIIAPTRELAEQIHVEISALGRQTPVRSMSLYGGVGMLPQIQQLRRGIDIVVACPGRLLDHLRQGTIDLSSLEVLVLDEADRLFDMGFIPDIRQIVAYVPTQRQTLLFAATMPIRQAYLNGMIPSRQRATIISFDSMMGSSGGVWAQPVLGRAADHVAATGCCRGRPRGARDRALRRRIEEACGAARRTARAAER